MPLRPPAGFIRPGYDPLKVPNAPTIGTATGGDQSASVAFTPPADVGGSAVSQYQAITYTNGTYVSNTTGTASPINVTGLTNGTPYTFQVWALNTYGPSPYSAVSNSVTPAVPPIGLFGGGNGAGTNTVQYINISTTGNATFFGNLTTSTSVSFAPGAVASGTRAVWAGGRYYTNVIQYVTIATTGNATDFGDLTLSVGQLAGASNSTRGVFAGGTDSGNTKINVIQYITIASAGNATDFGDLTLDRTGLGGCANTTRAVYAGGSANSGNTNVIDYVTISSTGNAVDFGDLNGNGGEGCTGCSNSTRGLFTRGDASRDSINYITISTTGDAANFGNLSVSRNFTAGAASSTRAVFAGGEGTTTSLIDYVTIATTGNATAFGNLSQNNYGMGGCSSAHGGL